MTTKDFAKKLKITPKNLRRILRTVITRYDDGQYTRYKLTETDQKRVMKHLSA